MKTSDSITDRPDEWLLRQWKSGNEQAAEVFFDRYAMRLVALVASRLNRRYQGTIDPDEVVQSAMVSFFDAARHSRIEVSGSVSLWRLLATFARRKMTRSIERFSAAKRGGDLDRVSWDEAEFYATSKTSTAADDEADELLRVLKAELPEGLSMIVESLLAGQTQREVAESLGIDERTVRRRMVRLREHLTGVEEEAGSTTTNTTSKELVASSTTKLPRVGYHEFVLGKLVGSGGFGKVYRASMQSSGETVAIKFLRKAFWQQGEARQTFLREINIASRINHRGVIRYLGYGESPHGGPYVLSQWIDGQPMHAITNATIKRFSGWLIQVCHALEAVHDASLIHGDLTPGNILVDKYDRTTITDFGFSQASSAGATSILGGTIGFAAPEQFDPSFGRISPKTDIYAIGGLVHWFLFKRPPQSGESPAEMLFHTIGSDRQAPQKQPGIPTALIRILAATLVPAPSQRTITLRRIIRYLHHVSTLDRSRETGIS